MKFIQKSIQLTLPFVLGIGILWWMYRGTNWHDFFCNVWHRMHWSWMLFSMVFGILAQVIRSRRWKMALLPVDECPRNRTSDDAIFISYAASLIIPRIGEITRCGTLKRYEDISFTKSLGTVFTERIVDTLVMLILTVSAFLLQIPVFKEFIEETGVSFSGFMQQFSTTGYFVTLLCLVATLGAGIYILRKYVARGRDLLHNLKEGILSLRGVRNLPLYILMSFGISFCYFLHFYIAFFSFDFTSHISLQAAFLIFCVGMFAVIVPTPNGAGPWHFAVKTMLVLYGVAESDAILFALVVHTLQTGLVVLLGIYGWADLSLFVRPIQHILRKTSPQKDLLSK